MTINPGEWGVQGMLEEQVLGAQFNPLVPTGKARARAALPCAQQRRLSGKGECFKRNRISSCGIPKKTQNLVLLPSPKMQIHAEWGIWKVSLPSTRHGSASIFSFWWNPILDLATRFTKPKDLPCLMIYDEAKENWYGFLRQNRDSWVQCVKQQHYPEPQTPMTK